MGRVLGEITNVIFVKSSFLVDGLSFAVMEKNSLELEYLGFEIYSLFCMKLKGGYRSISIANLRSSFFSIWKKTFKILS